MTAQDQQSRAVIAAWNAQTDEHNQWETLGDDEKIEWAMQAARALPASMKPVAEIYAGDLFRVNQGPDAEPVTGNHDLYTAAQVLAMGRVPPGWQAVPVEPTAEQINAAHERGFFRQLAIPLYDAMLAEAPRPPIAQKRYRLLVRNVDTIQADDEFLRDADSNWQIDPQGIFVGMTYMSNVLLPARRAIDATT